MATRSYRDVGSFAAAMSEVAADIGKARKAMEREGALAAVEVFKPAVSRATGGDNRMSGVRGAEVRVVTKAGSEGNLVRVTGPFHLVERSTKAHQIKPRGRALKLARGFAGGPVDHPGTRGKGTWAKAEPGAVEAATMAMVAAFDKGVT